MKIFLAVNESGLVLSHAECESITEAEELHAWVLTKMRPAAQPQPEVVTDVEEIKVDAAPAAEEPKASAADAQAAVKAYAKQHGNDAARKLMADAAGISKTSQITDDNAAAIMQAMVG